MTRLRGDCRGSTAVEFALVGPLFLMFLFLILDGGRLVFTRQGLNELAQAGARCAALKAPGCTTETLAEGWTIAQGARRSNIFLAAGQVEINRGTTCRGQGGMAQAIIRLPYNSTALGLLPRNASVSTLTAIGCFPVAA
jgi:Flp pilus assembly protein TadG